MLENPYYLIANDVQRYGQSAAKQYHNNYKKRGNCEIINVCRGKIKNQNGYEKHCRTAFGFRWKYYCDVEGSTTIEMDGKTYYRPK